MRNVCSSPWRAEKYKLIESRKLFYIQRSLIYQNINLTQICRRCRSRNLSSFNSLGALLLLVVRQMNGSENVFLLLRGYLRSLNENICSYSLFPIESKKKKSYWTSDPQGNLASEYIDFFILIVVFWSFSPFMCCYEALIYVRPKIGYFVLWLSLWLVVVHSRSKRGAPERRQPPHYLPSGINQLNAGRS